jgi:methyl-accepting chemotaxis protein
MAALQNTVKDNPAQVARFQEAETLISDWVANVTEQAIALRGQVNAGSRPLQDIQTLVARQEGKKYFDAFRVLIAAFSDVEKGLITERQEKAGSAGTKVTSDLQVMNQNEEWVTHTYGVICQANDILSVAVDMETGMRGYLLAGQEDFLAPYTGGAKRFHELVASLSETVSDNPAQVQLLAEIEQTIGEWQENVTEPTIALRRKVGSARTMDDMADLIGEARGKQYFVLSGD